MTMLQTEHEFRLPKGYVDQEGTVHRDGVMRLATAMDEIVPLRDARVKNNESYLNIIILSRVIERLGTLNEVNTGTIERMFTADLAYLQDLYQRINDPGEPIGQVSCPNCKSDFEIALGELMAPVGE